MIPLIKDKKLIYIALVPFFISMALNFPFPHKNPYGKVVVSALNIPIKSVNGFHYVGITSLLLLIVSLYLLVKSLKKYHVRGVVIAILVAIFTPPYVASTFQKTIATGIYAISYESQESICNFEMKNETTLHGVCELPFENYSRNSNQFTIEFVEHYPYEDDVRMVSLMNNAPPYEVMLRGKERKRVIIETDIDVSQMEDHIDGGQAGFVTIIIKSGEITRKL
ncbi:hypothetical protein ACIQ2D_15320 [Lysinibacillus sp. NPDC097287]|uniref:hypothetical protein n=1 Tax=Lysinibacillus sp. NPDC097287 TaxID=3364144 RepID=UPI00381D7D63